MQKFFYPLLNDFGLALIKSLDKMLDLWQRIDTWWDGKDVMKKKNIRNNFQKMFLILVIISMRIYYERLINTVADRNSSIQNDIQQELNAYITKDIEKLREENAQLKEIKDNLIKKEAEVNLLKEQLKKD